MVEHAVVAQIAVREHVVAEALAGAPETFKSTPARWRELSGDQYLLQVAVEDCTGCALCVEVCPAKDKSQVGRKALNLAAQRPLRETEAENWQFFLGVPDTPVHHEALRFNTIMPVGEPRPSPSVPGRQSG